jgi:hypothetical protein
MSWSNSCPLKFQEWTRAQQETSHLIKQTMVFIHSYLLGCNTTCYLRWLPVCWRNILPAPSGQKRVNLNGGLHMAGSMIRKNCYPLHFVQSRFYLQSPIPVSDWSNLIIQLYSKDRASKSIQNVNTHYQTTWCHNPEDDALYVHCHKNLNILCTILYAAITILCYDIAKQQWQLLP